MIATIIVNHQESVVILLTKQKVFLMNIIIKVRFTYSKFFLQIFPETDWSPF